MFTGISLITILSWMSAGVGVFGVLGFVLLLFVGGPAAAMTAVTIVKDALGVVLSTRIGVGIMVGIICLSVGYFSGDRLGRSAEDAKYAEALQKANQQADQRDRNIGGQANADAQARIKALEKSNAAYAAKIGAYTKIIQANAKNGACLLSPADIDRLR
jgi:hypothetical protein